MPAIPYREAELARPRARKGGDQQPTKKGMLLPVRIPEADPEWHPIARMFYESLLESGQSDFYQQSDWAFAYSLADDITAYKNQTWRDGTVKRSPEMLKAILGGMSLLLVTEGDRRRVRLELMEEVEQDDTEDQAVNDYKARLRLVK